MTTDHHDLAILDSNGKTVIKVSDATLHREKYEEKSWVDLTAEQKKELYTDRQLLAVAAGILEEMLADDLAGTMKKLGLTVKVITLTD